MARPQCSPIKMHTTYPAVKYAVVGIANTLIHAAFFFLLTLSLRQSVANLIAFFAASTFSFYANAKFTFKAAPKPWKYMVWVIFMGLTSYGVGSLCDALRIRPLFTFVLHCLLSFIIGFLFSKNLFKERVIQ